MLFIGQLVEVLLGGLLAGVLYSLVAFGFVLIYKASRVFNFAQGAMVLLAGLALVRASNFLSSSGAPLWLATLLGLMFAGAIMVACAWLIERLVLRQLINQDGLTLFMATIGVTFIMEGASNLFSDLTFIHFAFIRRIPGSCSKARFQEVFWSTSSMCGAA